MAGRPPPGARPTATPLTSGCHSPNEPQHPSFSCSCSVERVRAMLKSLGRAESDAILAEREDIEIGCDFCGAQYRFDAVDVGELFTPPSDQPPAGTNVH